MHRTDQIHPGRGAVPVVVAQVPGERARPRRLETVEQYANTADGQRFLLEVPFDEWETVYRERLQLERAMLDRALRRGGVDPGSPAAGSADGPAPLSQRLAGWAGIGFGPFKLFRRSLFSPERSVRVSAALERAAESADNEESRKWVGKLSRYLDCVEIVYE